MCKFRMYSFTPVHTDGVMKGTFKGADKSIRKEDCGWLVRGLVEVGRKEK